MEHVDLCPIIQAMQQGIINNDAKYTIISASEVLDTTLEPNLTYRINAPIEVVDCMGETVIDEDSLTRNEVAQLLHVKKLIAERNAPQYRMDYWKRYHP